MTPRMKRTHVQLTGIARATLATLALMHAGRAASEGLQLSGDLGMGATRSQAVLLGERSRTKAIPYLNIEYGPAFARVDTFGVNALPMGAGHLELVGQARGDGYQSSVLETRHGSLPLGLGTLQITPVGGFLVNALHDFGRSGGSLLQARWIAQLTLGRVTIYPEVGFEYQTPGYVRYYDGTTEADAAMLGRAYRPGSAFNPFVGAMVETQLTERWYLNTYVRRTVFDDSITRSPIVVRKAQNSLLMSLAYRF
jgi:outer membrane scaffolding protein for murein synthesis (MipA/OmpV family)